MSEIRKIYLCAKILIIITAKAIDSVFHKPGSVFVTATVREFLWTGLPVDCTVTDLQGKAICSLLAENEASFIKEGPGKYRFALLGAVSLRIMNQMVGTYESPDLIEKRWIETDWPSIKAGISGLYMISFRFYSDNAKSISNRYISL